MTGPELAVALTDARDAAAVGGKGASLGELTRAGVAVPPGFVVTVGAFALAMAGIEAPSKPRSAKRRSAAVRMRPRVEPAASASSGRSWPVDLSRGVPTARALRLFEGCGDWVCRLAIPKTLVDST